MSFKHSLYLERGDDLGDHRFSETSYNAAISKHTSLDSGPVTKRAEQNARVTGKLNPLVDPAEYGVIRRSLPRFNQLANTMYELTVGIPIPSETRLDTTGSMGNNVDVAIKALPDSYGLCSRMLPGFDLQVAIGIFGDVGDNFVICRPQFEMTAEKIVEQLTLMVPERAGHDTPEDPHYGLFGSAYLTSTYVEKIGLKGYDFTVSDAPARELLNASQLKRIFGDQVFEKVTENGHDTVDWYQELIRTKDVVNDLQKRAHAFFLQVGDDKITYDFWQDVFGKDRVVILPDIKYLPHVQATIIGLTEGTLTLNNVMDFLTQNNVVKYDAERITRSVSNIPIGAQVVLRTKLNRDLPKKGDLFKSKTDLWPSEESFDSTDPKKTEAVEIKWL